MLCPSFLYTSGHKKFKYLIAIVKSIFHGIDQNNAWSFQFNYDSDVRSKKKYQEHYESVAKIAYFTSVAAGFPSNLSLEK